MAPNVKDIARKLEPLFNGSSNNQLDSGTVAVDPGNDMVTHQTENTIAEPERPLLVHDVPHRGEYYIFYYLVNRSTEQCLNLINLWKSFFCKSNLVLFLQKL